MSSGATDYQFKKFQNTTRTFSSEEQFNLGMNYTDSPIEAGQAKVLLNFDVANDGVSLRPRAGFRTTKAVVSSGTTYTPNGAQILSAVMEERHNGVLYKGIITFDYNTKKLCIGTVSSETNPEITSGELDIETMTFERTSITVKYTDNSNMAIHGINIPQSVDSCEQIGTKAWNNAYYFFGTSGSTTNLYSITFNESTKKFTATVVTPTTLTALEASPNKFNMLLTNPYTFTNSIVAGSFVLQGILCYQNNQIIVSPRINTKYRYKLAYTVPSNTTYTIKWDWKDYNGTAWTTLKTETKNITTTASDIYCDFASPIENSLMRVTITKDGATYPEQVLAIGINCDAETQQSSANSELKNYNLHEATGMCYWQNRLVLWGYDDPIIFVSDTNLPEWFPYPNNIDLFEEPIIHCEPYLDSLLVFTTQKLFQLTMLSDGSGWSKTCIQNHLHLTEFDTNFIKTIKNMVFFKSGNSYFMVVPSATTAAGLTIAPIAKPIQWMLDNYKKAVSDIIKDVYNYSESLELIYCFNYINDVDVVNNYVFKDDTGVYINFCLLYDTEERTWRTHVFESESIYRMYKLDATTNGTLVTLTDVLKIPDGSTSTQRGLAAQFITRDESNPEDFYIPKQCSLSKTANLKDTFKTKYKYGNYQFFDTGYRSLGEANTKKRHREFQLRINNKAGHLLKFGTSFYIDGEDRKNMYKYEVQHITDPNSEDYGVIEVVPALQLDSEIHSETILAELKNDENSWTIGDSRFPQVPLNKIRIAVSGKGYHNKLKFLSVNELDYELLGLCWVFKYKNLR